MSLFEQEECASQLTVSSRTDEPQSEGQSMESDQYEDQNVRNNATEVQSTDRAGQTNRAVYQIDPLTSGLELQHNPRTDGRINRTEAAFPVLFAKLRPSVKLELNLVEWNPNPTEASPS
ncbi:hypothetical protein F2Q69_00006853 [Brassica cretica]|uniref:Uncharacterized protein n=1 Tax=Brassica cretica TaxID=69181 RepID=A0A8S9PLU7_BRACR|nr:hypothetical protein F2Q69_00006853 [Brassica cretica]